MPISHRKLAQQQDSDQYSPCSDCGPTCTYNCTYTEFYWPPEPENTTIAATITTTTTTTAAAATAHMSPYVIIMVTLLGSVFLFFSYYLIMVRCSTRFRRPPATQISDEAEDFSDEDHGIEVDHPIWYINTIGLQSSVIDSISVFKYKKDENLIDGTDCSVCLSEFQDKETLRLLPKCNHAFHIPCIDTWLSSHTNCPLCRAGILSNPLSAVLSSDDHSFSPTIGSNSHHTQMENLDDRGDTGRNSATNVEISDEYEDSKTEYESVTVGTGSISIDSLANIILKEDEMIAGDSTLNLMISEGGDI